MVILASGVSEHQANHCKGILPLHLLFNKTGLDLFIYFFFVSA